MALSQTKSADFAKPTSSRLVKLRGPGLEITPVNGSQADNALLGFSKKPTPTSGSASKGSKLESALDRLGFQKRKVSCVTLPEMDTAWRFILTGLFVVRRFDLS